MKLEPNQPVADVTQLAKDQGVDIRRYLQVLLKWKWLILATILLVVGGVGVWTYFQTKIYKASSTIIVDRRAPQVLGKDVGEVVDLSTGSYWSNKEYMKTQEKVIKSKLMAQRVAEQHKLHQNKAFWTKAKLRKKRYTLDDAARRLQALTSAKVIREANLIEISVQHPNRKIAAKLANAVSDNYLTQNLEYKSTSTKGAVKWLTNQLDDLQKQLKKAELALHSFKKKNNIVTVSLEDTQTLIARRIDKLSDALTDVRLKRMTSDIQMKSIAKADKLDPLNVVAAPVMESISVKALKETYVKEYRDYVAVSQRYLDKHPLVRQQKAKMDAALADLKREVKNVLQARETLHRQTRKTEGRLAAALQTAKEEAIGINKHEVTYRELKRKQENIAKLYGLVLTRMKESHLSSQLSFNNMRHLDRAVEPTVPIKPRLKLNLLIGFVLGLLLGIGLAFLVETLDSSVKDQGDIEAVPGLIHLGLMPRIPGSSNQRRGHRPDPKPELDLIVHRNPKSPVAESCRAIRTNLLFSSPDRPMRRVAVTSAGPREGKTTTAVSLAITMAQAGSRVLVVDTDMRRPRMHKVFGVPGSEGITSILLGDSQIEDVTKTTEIPNLFVLPCGPTPPSPAELCQSARFKSLLDELNQRYDWVVLDSPPVMVVTDAVVLSTLVDGMLIVARTGQTSRVALTEAVRHLTDVGANILGCVLNDMDLEKGGYGYYRYRRYGYAKYGSYRYEYGRYGDKEEEEAAG